MTEAFVQHRHDLNIDGVAVDIAAMSRPGERDPIVFLHGFGFCEQFILKHSFLFSHAGMNLMILSKLTTSTPTKHTEK